MAEEAEDLTVKNKKLNLTIALNYGGWAEVVDAVKQLPPKGKIDEMAIRARLYAPELPDPDLIVRTSGEKRISNFLLWQGAYAELLFTEVLWPDFRRDDLFAAIAEYQRRSRRFGGVD
jgi:undecaprenyl diphosphate synthase